ncbi:hypothetical protein CBR_g4729 [Chara braunii]|uniref:Uncharacterized protein n=1 Tax=Chara braunii TaxID=69332 RepID=A0A388KIM0_CHABU|nr:hypothetical protein CBR_g4729 [Chara braunii]|eukprot:GBG69901.1 hypothetical protein CBR_g4729 [Chara braunii]
MTRHRVVLLGGRSTEVHTPIFRRLQRGCCTCGRPPLPQKGTGRNMSTCARRGVTVIYRLRSSVGHLDALDEVRSGAAEGCCGGPVDEDPEPLVWGARPRASVTEEELAATKRRLQKLGSRPPRPVSEVFGARAAVLLPYEAEVPEEEVVDDGAREVRADAVDDDDDWTDPREIACRADKRLERVYFAQGGHSTEAQPQTTLIRADDDPPRGASNTRHGTGRGAGTSRTGHATRPRMVFGADRTDDERIVKDDEALLRVRRSAAPDFRTKAQPLRRSERLVSRDGTTPQKETPGSQHLDDIQGDVVEGKQPEQRTTAQQEPSQDVPSYLRTRDFMVGGEGTPGGGIGRRQHVRLGDMADYYPHDTQREETVTQAECDAQIDVEEERCLSRMQRAGKVAYLEEVECMRRLETIGAGAENDKAEAVIGPEAALQPWGGGQDVTGHANVPHVSASPPVQCKSLASQAPLTSVTGFSGATLYWDLWHLQVRRLSKCSVMRTMVMTVETHRVWRRTVQTSRSHRGCPFTFSPSSEYFVLETRDLATRRSREGTESRASHEEIFTQYRMQDLRIAAAPEAGVQSGAYTSGEEALPMRAGERRHESLTEIDTRIAAHDAEIAALREGSTLASIADATRDNDTDTEEEPIDVGYGTVTHSTIRDDRDRGSNEGAGVET